tara:strand:- start:961 stop:1149 length:189 start_codon:yes stop_codon:yes gene_type:complete
MASLLLELEEEPDTTDTLLYSLMGEMFSIEIAVEGDMLEVSGKKHDIWAWLSFVAWYAVDLT